MRFSILLCGALLGAAEPSYQDGALSLDGALRILKAKNLEIKAAEYDVQSARESADEAGAFNWGTLDFIQNVSRSDDAGNVFGFKLTGRQANFGDFGFSDFMACQSATPPAYCANVLERQPDDLNNPADRNFFQTKLEYTLPLYTGGKISGYMAAAEAMEQMKTLDRDKVLNLKIYETRKAYYDMRLLDEVLKNLRTIDENIATLEAMTQQMIQEGYAKKTDLLEVQAKRGNVSRSIHQMEANEALLYHYLSFLLNQPVEQIAVPESDILIPILDDAKVVAGNLDVLRAQTGLQIRESMKKVARSGYLPTLGMQASVQTAADKFENYAMDKGSYTVGVQLKWNVFSGGGDTSRMEKAQIEYLKTKTQVELAKKGIALQIRKIRTEIQSLDYEIESLTHELALAKEIYVSYEERYREQLASMNDVIIKQSEELQKVLELLQIKNKRNERVFALEKLANGVEQ